MQARLGYCRHGEAGIYLTWNQGLQATHIVRPGRLVSSHKPQILTFSGPIAGRPRPRHDRVSEALATLTQGSPNQIRSNKLLSDRFDEALAYASRLHREQRRKGTNIPYISHLLSVAALVLEHGGNEDQAIAGLLHDAVEDQGGQKTLDEIRRRFGETVATIVADCTDAWEDPKPEWRPRKEAYIATLPTKDRISLLVSLADKTHNARAILHDYRDIGDPLWGRFSGGKEGTLWYYRTLSTFYSETFQGPLASELERTVAAFCEGDRSTHSTR